MRPVFLPVVDLERNVLAGFELLVSIVGPPEAPPPVWFSMAAQQGLGGALEARIVRTGLAARAQLPAETFLSINVGAAALVSPQMQSLFGRGQRFDDVVFEVKEGEVGAPGLREALEPFRAAGGRLAIDDLGAGFTVLRTIAELRPEFAKIDRLVTSRVASDPPSAAVAESLITLASRIGATVVAEGIEQREELDAVRRLGIGMAQGFFFGRRHQAIADAQAGFTAPGTPAAAGEPLR